MVSCLCDFGTVPLYFNMLEPLWFGRQISKHREVSQSTCTSEFGDCSTMPQWGVRVQVTDPLVNIRWHTHRPGIETRGDHWSRSFLVCSIGLGDPLPLRVSQKRYRAVSLLAISPRLYVPCAGPKCNKVMAGEGCPAAGKESCATIPYDCTRPTVLRSGACPPMATEE